jgi:hypothetical protein
VGLEEPLDELAPDEEVPAADDPPLEPDEGAAVLQIATGGTGGVGVVGEVSACAAAGSATASTLIVVATVAHLLGAVIGVLLLRDNGQSHDRDMSCHNDQRAHAVPFGTGLPQAPRSADRHGAPTQWGRRDVTRTLGLPSYDGPRCRSMLRLFARADGA